MRSTSNEPQKTAPAPASSSGLPLLVRNCSTATKLPAEILSKIFQEVQWQSRSRPPLRDEPLSFAKTPYEGYGRWIPRITHVCSSWRKVALANPLLWSSTFGGSYTWAHECLRRSRDAPLDLSFAPLWPVRSFKPDAQDYLLIQAAFARPDRIRSIHFPVSMNGDKATAVLKDLIETPSMPSLVTLSLAIRFRPWVLPDTFLATPGCVPKLRRLVLNNCIINLKTPRLCNLRYLELRAHGEEATLPLIDIFDVMQELSLLEDVQLRNAISSSQEGHGVDSAMRQRNLSTFKFPRLLRLGIESDNAIPIHLFNYAHAPSIMHINISADVRSDTSVNTVETPEEIKALYSFASFNFPSLSSESAYYIHDLTLSRPLVNRVFNKAYITTGHLKLEHHQIRCGDRNLVRSLCIDNMLDDPDGWHDQLERLWTAIPCDELHKFTLHYDTGPYNEIRSPISLPNTMLSLANSKSITTLSVPYRYFVDSSPSFLSTCNGATFPALRDLVLGCDTKQPKDESLLILRDWLVEREERGLQKILSFSIADCQCIEAKMVEVFQELVGDFNVSFKLNKYFQNMSGIPTGVIG
ncbi:hypothetical protein ONZ45_g5040 [Pleurotus djamor]|nr:hypothetical protein ONZ45_g5040 [Pleurotus djamor]